MLIEFKQLDGVSAFYRVDPEKDNFYSIDECVYMEHIESEDENITLFMGKHAGEEFALQWCDILNSKKEVGNDYVALDITESEDDDDDTLAIKKFILAHEICKFADNQQDRLIFNGNNAYITYDWGNVLPRTATRTVTTTTGTGVMHGWVTNATGDWRTI